PARFWDDPDPLVKGAEIKARHIVTTEARFVYPCLAFVDLDEAIGVGLFEPLPDLVEQLLDGRAPLVDHGFHSAGIVVALLNLLVQELSKGRTHVLLPRTVSLE